MTMGKSPFMMEHCGDRKSWTVMVEDQPPVDLEAVANRIVASGWSVGIRTNICWTFLGEAKLTLYSSGRLTIKSEDEVLAASIAQMHVEAWLR